MNVNEETQSSTESETPTTPPAETTTPETNEQETTPESSQASSQQAQAEAPAPLAAADITLPEGFQADEQTLTSFVDVFNNADLSAKERAEQLMNLHADTMKRASEEISEQWTKTREGWVDQVKADPEIGGDKLESDVMPTIGKLVTEFGSEDLRTLMDESGMGDHPEFVKFLYKIGKSFGEGTVVSGTPSDAPKTLANRLYPNQGA